MEAREIRVGSFGGGNGSSQISAFILSSADHFRALAEDVRCGMTYRGAFFRLTCDIDMQGEEWTPIGVYSSAFESHGFGGVLLGGGFAIHSFSIRASGDGAAGIFAYLDGAEIHDLKIGNFVIDSRSYTGGLAAVALASRFTNCHVGGSIALSSPLAADASVGGLIGRAIRCEVRDSTSGCSVTASDCDSVGGLVGLATNSTRIERCRTLRDVFAANARCIGGCVGRSEGSDILDTTSMASVKGLNNDCSGGFCGLTVGSSFSSCSASGSIISRTAGTPTHAGGFVGRAEGSVSGCACSGDVDASGSGTHAGGFAGSAIEGRISSCSSFGSVSGEGIIGGFVGYMNCKDLSRVRIEDCCSSGDVRVSGPAEASTAAGFAAQLDRDGGSVVIMRCYSFGAHYGTPNGFVGKNIYGNIASCFWRRDENVNADKGSSHAVPSLTTDEFADKARFESAGWTFIGDDAAWCYTGAVAPPRPHPSAAPVMRVKKRRSANMMR